MVHLDSLFERVILEINNRSHLQALLPDRSFSILFTYANFTWTMNLSCEECKVFKGKKSVEIGLTINASKKALELLLNGDTRLQQLMKSGDVTVHGSYRQLLVVEAILYLCREYKIA